MSHTLWKCVFGTYAESESQNKPSYLMRNAEKEPLCNLRTTKTLISQADLGLRCPLTESMSIVGHACRRKENAQIRLQRCAYWSGPTLSANCIRSFFRALHIKLLCYEHSWSLHIEKYNEQKLSKCHGAQDGKAIRCSFMPWRYPAGTWRLYNVALT